MAAAFRRDAPPQPDFSLLKRLARDQLIFLLEQLPGKKDLFIDADLMSPLDRIANVSTLKQHEVDKLYKVEHKAVVSSADQLCFLIRPRIQTVKWICDLVKSDKAVGRVRRYKIIFTPQKFFACEAILEEHGAFGDVSCDQWDFHLLPVDDDIISLELPEFFTDTFLAGDQRWVRTVGSALHLLHSLFGPFSKVYGIGRIAKMVYESFRIQLQTEETRTRGDAQIGNVFIIDRDVDLVTPLCSQVVYEGLVDDIFRIKCGCVEFSPDVTSSEKSVKVMLNSQDKVFNEIRNEHFSNVFGFLSQKARTLQTAYDRRRGMDIKQMKTFVSEELKGLKQEHRLLSLHIGASEAMMKRKTKQDFQEMLRTEHSLLEGFEIRECINFIEEHINRQVSVLESLRLLCLLSLTENGLLPKDLRSLKAQYLQSYGFEHLLTFSSLRTLGLIQEQQTTETLSAVETRVRLTAGRLTEAFSSLAKKSNFRALSRRLNLVPKSEDYDLRVPKDMSYVFSGAYVPLSCRLIEQVLDREGWSGLEEVTRLLNRHEFSVTGSTSGSEGSSGLTSGAGSGLGSTSSPGFGPDSQRRVLVLFLGGCTFSEIAALRFLARERGYRITTVTTAITNSSRLLESLVQNKV
ncbi:vacuolar protein sorting-associated protein 33B [Periophthalmus magnuspinnatus]|uniref:vacuolar protein sorting-associated protein 33B n=1 Tax=Periophthalmus magnuspinnatus TaxID=409849 RepID=UPI00145A72F1|nr:vacuolar protein sorting-associated protein 33B [Periophthalmus magnuspinnatus]